MAEEMTQQQLEAWLVAFRRTPRFHEGEDNPKCPWCGHDWEEDDDPPVGGFIRPCPACAKPLWLLGVSVTVYDTGPALDCPSCGKTVAVEPGGTLEPHQAADRSRRCPGSGEKAVYPTPPDPAQGQLFGKDPATEGKDA
jgi:hypothetical protein